MAATLTTLIARVRQRADMVSTQFVTDAEVTNLINAAASELYLLLAERRKEWFTISEQETISSGNTLDLSSVLANRLVHLTGVDYSYGGEWHPLRPYEFEQRGAINTTDATTGTYRIWYVPEMTLLSGSNSMHWSIPQELEEFVVVGAAIKAKDKEEADTSMLEREHARLRREAEYLAATRKRHGRISDYDGDVEGCAGRVYSLIGSTLYIYLAEAT